MSDTTPTSLEDIIQAVFNAGRIAAGEVVADVHGSWIALRPDVAIAAINALIPEKYPEVGVTQNQMDWARGFNAAIDTIHRNFTGQTDNERKQADEQ